MRTVLILGFWVINLLKMNASQLEEYRHASDVVRSKKRSLHISSIQTVYSFWLKKICRSHSLSHILPLYAKPVSFFFEFAESPIKIFKKCKIRTRFAEPTPLPPQCLICSIFSASYVTHSVLHMCSIQCSICALFSAPYVVYSALHMWPIQCLICALFSAPYVLYSVLHM